jgi:hypothetical protein
MAEIKERLTASWIDHSQTTSQDLVFQDGLRASSRDESSASAQNSNYTVPPPPPPPPPDPLTSSTIESPIVPPPPPSTPPPVTALIHTIPPLQEQVSVLRNNNHEESFQYETQASTRPLRGPYIQIPRSVLKKKGGQIFQRQRPTEPQLVEITADDLLRPHLTVPESTTEPVPKKQVTFLEPVAEKPLVGSESHRITSRQRKQLSDAILARRQLFVIRNNAEIERRNFSSSRSLLYENLNTLLSLGPTLMSSLSKDGAQKPSDSLLHDFEKSWTKVRATANIILKQHSVFEDTIQRLTGIENSLISLDNRVREKDQIRLDEAGPITPEDDDTDEDDALSNQSNESPASAHSDSSARTPSLVREYYDKIGEVVLTRDYIHNLDTEHLKTVHSRKSLKGLGVKLDIPDSQVYQEYVKDRRELLTYYIRNKEAVQTLWRLCRDNEYPVEAPNLPPQDPDMDHSIRPSNTATGLLNHEYAPSEGSTTIGHIIPPDIHEPVIASRSRILKWLKDAEKDLRPEKGWDLDTICSLASDTPDNNPSIALDTIGSFDRSEEERTETDLGSKSDNGAAIFQAEKIFHRYSDPNLRFKALDCFAKVRKRLKVRRAFSDSS